MRSSLVAALMVLALIVPVVLSAQSPFWPPVAFTDEPAVPPLPQEVTDDRRVARNYPEQPPVIPHSIRDYQINLNTNRCLTCHSRKFTAVVQAPMISITHYVDREGQTLGAVSPRRYFCLQCHVPQTSVQPIVKNTFVDVDTLIARPTDGEGSAP